MTRFILCCSTIATLCSVTAPAEDDVYARLPHGPGFRNVRDFGAKGDGVTDDTAAFRAALVQGRGVERFKSPANVYVPAGTYILSDTIIIWRATQLVGDATDRPTLVLTQRSPGFGNPDNPKPLLVTAGGYNIDPTTRDWETRTNEKGGSTNNTFYITVRHLKIRIEPGNPGAWGLYWLVAQQTALRHVTIDAGDAQGCMRSMWWGGGGAISHVEFNGGEYGWHTAQTSQFVMRSAYFRRQRKASLWLNGAWNFCLLDLHLQHTAPVKLHGSYVTLIDSSLSNVRGDCAIDAQESSLVLADVRTRGVDEVVGGLLQADPGNGTHIRFWAAGDAMIDGRSLEGRGHDLSACNAVLPDHWPSPEYPLPGPQTRSVTEFGAAGDDAGDDTAAIQRAIDSVDDVFFPEGEYLVSDTLRLRSGSRLFGEMWSHICLRSDSPGFQNPASRKPLLLTPEAPAAAVVSHLWLRNMAPGGIAVGWRAGEQSLMIDTRVSHHSKTQQLGWQISGQGGGLIENGWNPGVSGDGLLITSSGRKWLYAVHQEHYRGMATEIRGAKNLAVLLLQFENSPDYLRIRDSENIAMFALLAGNWGEPVEALAHVHGGRNVALFNARVCKTRRVVREMPGGFDAGPSSSNRSFAGHTAWIKRRTTPQSSAGELR